MTAPARPLVLAVVGTDHHPFDRLVSWVDDWSRSHDETRVVIQYGTSSPPGHAEGHGLLPTDELSELLHEATAVVSHGGPGTIMAARDAGVVPICIPRRHGLGEHVDDHQVRFIARVAEGGLVTSVDDASSLDASLSRALAGADGTRIDPAAGDPAAPAVARFADLVERLMERR